jgi:hypothetical protein
MWGNFEERLRENIGEILGYFLMQSLNLGYFLKNH